MATIKAIEGRSVHQIQSGQVIVDLQSVCKELVENSIDAGASSIEVRFRNNGLDAIEVQDNGHGIAPEDFQTIALKHYTSKLSTYDDLNALQTFGFRGEALSSLCALSKFHITTARASDGSKGTKLEFEQSGKLKGTSVVAAKQGTTVVVETLFHNLPVRRKELEKNIKREYNKVLSLLNAYACISTGVKFSVSNLMPKGKKTVAFSTNANPNTKENIANVYGTKTLLALLPLSLEFELNPTNRPAHGRNINEEGDSRKVMIVGHISRPVVGEGRQTPDRQMFFVNSRPCLLPQVAKAFNEVYKSYNITQSPFIFADLKLDTNAYDVNVSPDKRSILLHDQTALLESLKDSLVELFEGHDQSVPQSQLLGKTSLTRLPFKSTPTPRRESTIPAVEECHEDDETAQIADVSSKSVSQTENTPSEPSTGTTRSGFIKASMLGKLPSDDTGEDATMYPPAKRRKNDIPVMNSSVSIGEREVPTLQHRSPSSPGLGDQSRDRERESASPLFEPEKIEPIPAMRSDLRILQDFNTRVAAHHAIQLERETTPTSQDETGQEEESIPAIKQTPQTRSSQSTVQNAFDRMRPMWTPTQKATITVGDTTTVSTIGSGSRSTMSGLSRRDRIHTPKFALDGTPLKQYKQPSILKSLRGFAAPGSQFPESDDEEQEEEEEDREGFEDEDEQEDSVMTDDPGNPLLNRAQVSRQSSVEPAHDAIEESPKKAPSVDESSGDEDVSRRQVERQVDDSGSDDEYVDESEKKAREDAKVAQMIADAEESAARPTELNLKRADKLFKVSQKKYSTVNLESTIETNLGTIEKHMQKLEYSLEAIATQTIGGNGSQANSEIGEDPEERLSLTVTKSDFNKMRIIGQFNLGFIIAVRPPTSTSSTSDLFIIDQHASDEKYNFERFSATTVLVSQRLVHPHPLELTAVEEEIILANGKALSANGFVVTMDMSGHKSVGHRAQLTSLPMSKEVTFTPTDLEELIALVLDNPPSSSLSTSAHIPRPSKVRKLLASRACRSSVMIGKTLKTAQMEGIVKHMGSMDKPWSCPHGRPTMRHLFGLAKWEGWSEGDGVGGVDDVRVETDWTGYLATKKKKMKSRA